MSLLVVGAPLEAHAEPPEFPDIGAYTPVNTNDYAVVLPNPRRAPLNRVYFLTPDGIACDFFSAQAQCTGDNFPSIPPPDASPNPDVQNENWIGTATGLKQTNSPIGAQGQAIKTLPPLHSITVDGIICGVDDKGTTACKDTQGRGFVLSPRGSAWLPKV